MQIPSLYELVNKPYYLFRPTQVLLRLQRFLGKQRPKRNWEETVLPWGLSIRYHPDDLIGSGIYRTGLYDICVSEVLWRLLDRGETAVDAGANIGHMTSVMAKRVGESGNVFSFEPHPDIFHELTTNVSMWMELPDVGNITLHEAALSKEEGTGNLFTTADFESNRGTASLESQAQESQAGYPVALKRLDDVMAGHSPIGVMKMDVEGHEFDLLQGATRLLSGHAIRDIVLEEKSLYPSLVTNYLESMGYELFSLNQGALGIDVAAAALNVTHSKYEAPSYLATLDVPRALARLKKKGYAVLISNNPKSKFGYQARVLLASVLALFFVITHFKRTRHQR